MFNIIDTSRGEKADLVPLSIEPRYRLQLNPPLTVGFDESLIAEQAQVLGPEVAELWQVIREQAADTFKQE